MKVTPIATAVVLLLATLTVGCASTPKQENSGQEYIFQNSLNDVNRAALESLTVLGFGIEKDTDNYVQGVRPRKGMIISSGGETVGVWLESISDQETKVKVDTAKSIVGIFGQEDWDEKIIIEMKKFLGSGA